ncbi:PP2C family protein-serine/threonine phosphatase [Kribbella sp. NPDC051587]|uniref:PP2C family protein-serine/threonine phosphatase n=1 Tax=Kribbella sp. NPDC051587 TaxID=3364119 RepID=UPI0037A959CD
MNGPELAIEPGLLDEASLVDGIGLTMAGSLNVRRSVLQLLDSLRPGFADWAAVALINPRTGGIQLYGGDDLTSIVKVSRRALAGQALERVLATGRSELLHVALEGLGDGLLGLIPHRALRDQAAALRPADVLGTGLTARGSTMGALITVRGQGRGFTPEDVAAAEQIAVRASMALDSARLYEQRSQIASALQQSLLPPELPTIPGLDLGARYRPAFDQLDIGGDFYDIFPRGDDWLVALGDVAGKGVEAAVLTGRARQSLRTAAHFESDPAALLSALNTVFHNDISNRFVTMICLRVRPLDDGSLEVTAAAAGHAPPLLIRASGGIAEVRAEGAVLGVVPVAEYSATTVRLDPGDQLVLFTDGVDEARGESGFYGHERLASLLGPYAGAPADVICAAIEQDVLEHLGGRAHDDIAVLALGCAR